MKSPFVVKGIFISALLLFGQTLSAQVSYFPPKTGDEWQESSFQEFPYDSTYTDSLLGFLEEKHSKAFLVLYDGKLVLESYFGTFTQDSVWYWASSGKSLSSFLTGMAREQGMIDIYNPASDYLGSGWSSCTPQQEEAILVQHLLSMSSGLDSDVPDLDCTDPSCLKYKADPGTRWYYHNAAYYKALDVLEAASGLTLNQFTAQHLSLRTGISGLWIDNLFVSKPRSAARFGLLNLNRGIWDGDTLLADQNYFDSMTHSSQNMNPAYGFLWWLNGSDTFMLPGSSFRLPGSLIPNAPADLYAALGKNDQKIYVVPSRKLVVVRMGDASGQAVAGPSSFDNELWGHIQRWLQLPSSLNKPDSGNEIRVYPNPADRFINLPTLAETPELYDLQGSKLNVAIEEGRLDCSTLKPGVYLLRFRKGGRPYSVRVMVHHP